MSININILSNFNSSGFDKLGRELKRLDTPIEKLGAITRSLAPAAIIGLGALALGANKSVTEANDLALGLREVVTLTGDTGDVANATFTEFQGLVAGLSKEFGIAQNILTGGLYQALSAGVPKENALAFMQVASQAAIAGVTDVETAVDGLTTVVNAFGLETSQTQDVADSMFAAVKGGKTTFEELSASLFNVAPMAAAAQVSFSEVNAAIATLTAAGVPTAEATTQIRSAFVALQDPSKEITAIFNNLGFESGEAAIKQKGLKFAMDAVYDATGGSASQMKVLLGRIEAVNAVTTLSGTGAGKFADELDRQATAAGSVQDAFDEVDKSRVLERQAVAFQNMGIAIGNVLIPVMEVLVPLFTGFAEFVADNSVVFTILAGIFGALAIAILAVNFALNANPIVKVITLVAALAAGLVILINWLVTLYGGWTKLFKDVGAGFVKFVLAIGRGLNQIDAFFLRVFQGIGNIAKGALNGILGFIEGYINFLISGINGLLNRINTLLSAGRTVGINVQVPTIPTLSIPRLAEGGIVMPRPGGVLANIAEAGQAEAVIPLDRLGKFGQGNQTTYNITVNGGISSGPDIGRSVVNAIRDFERQSGTAWRS
jgi:TP901 family phage tail tape measure protein